MLLYDDICFWFLFSDCYGSQQFPWSVVPLCQERLNWTFWGHPVTSVPQVGQPPGLGRDPLSRRQTDVQGRIDVPLEWNHPFIADLNLKKSQSQYLIQGFFSYFLYSRSRPYLNVLKGSSAGGIESVRKNESSLVRLRHSNSSNMNLWFVSSLTQS